MKVTSSQVIPKMKRKSVRRNFGHNAKNESKRNLLQQPRLVDPPGNCMALKVLAVIILVLFVAPLSFTSIPGFIAEGPGLSSEVGGVAAPPPQTCAMPVEELDIGEQIAQRSRIQPENEDNSNLYWTDTTWMFVTFRSRIEAKTQWESDGLCACDLLLYLK
ncbi:uncharacterized protein LOC117344246 isoform X3 [Pecten maximus]|uniref:uncharacterized protein LOC117333361 isoform X3 n=1 Tax=Pecten maximus TaxID=6579 RepID=UPI001458B34D|nr:uncharacterized protein LOC117333361 isoform X3 [Pecten maximus]XP_033762820.1 uncharacterized protein LOC117344246 isoform X3 [Pecten maximus]